jgi:hypothetical protein
VHSLSPHRTHRRAPHSLLRRRSLLTVSCLLSLCTASYAAAQNAPVSGNGSWCWFGDPRAVHLIGSRDQLIAGWVDPQGRVTVASYDYRSGARTYAVLARLSVDDHSNPSLLVEPDHRITAFYSAHNGSQLYYRTTLTPEDVSAWGPSQQILGNLSGSDGYTYPNPVLLSSEEDRLFLFWRGGNWNPAYATRTVGGTWSTPRQLIFAPGQRPYLKVDSNGRDTIAIAFTNGHPREILSSIYFAEYRHGFLWRADGHRIAAIGSRPIRPSEADRVYDAGRTRVPAWTDDVAIGAGGRPVILYSTIESAARHLYWYAAWSGRRWVSHFLVMGGPSISPNTIEAEYSGGMSFDHANPSVVYLSRKVRGYFQIERWSTANAGASWTHVAITSRRGVDNIRPVVARGAPGGLLWLSGHYGSYKAYHTKIVGRESDRRV